MRDKAIEKASEPPRSRYVSFAIPALQKPVDAVSALASSTVPDAGNGQASATHLKPDSVERSAPASEDLHSAVKRFAGEDVARTTDAVDTHLKHVAASSAEKKDDNPIPIGVAYRTEIYAAAKAHNLDPMLLAAQAAQESGGPGANSGRNVLQRGGGGHGLFQIDPAGGYGPWLKTHHNGLDVKENAEKAAAIDAKNLKDHGGDTKAMLTTYNAGHNTDADTAITMWPDGRHLHYAASVERHLQQLQQLAAEQHR